MATRKKKPAPKQRRPAAKKPTPKQAKPATKRRPAAAKPPAVKKGKAVAKKKAPPAGRLPPMHERVVHPELEDADHEEVFETFKAFDRDGSGSIDRAELARLLEALGQPIDEDELDVALDVIDSNHSGRISWSEFKAWWTSR
jgi:hypothetical protein